MSNDQSNDQKMLIQMQTRMLDALLGCCLTDQNGWEAARKGFKIEPVTGEAAPIASLATGAGYFMFRLGGVDPLLDERLPATDFTFIPQRLQSEIGNAALRAKKQFLTAYPVNPFHRKP